MNHRQSEIWNEPYFRKLNNDQKLFLIYIQDHRDRNGNFEIDTDMVNEEIGINVNVNFLESFLDILNEDKERIKKSGKLLRLTEPTDPDPVEEFIRKQNDLANTGNALKQKPNIPK